MMVYTICGLAIDRSAQPRNGSYSIIQPAEEDGSGAKVFSDTKFAAHFPDYVLPYIIWISKSDYSKNDTFYWL
jgi:hypothetical protein